MVKASHLNHLDCGSQVVQPGAPPHEPVGATGIMENRRTSCPGCFEQLLAGVGGPGHGLGPVSARDISLHSYPEVDAHSGDEGPCQESAILKAHE